MRHRAQGEDAEDRQVRYLSSTAVRDTLQHVLAGQGLRLHHARLVDLQHRPGAGATGVFQAWAVPDDAPDDGAPEEDSPAEGDAAQAGREVFVALTAEAVPEDAVVDAGRAAETDWSAWIHPHDPLLAGLALASDPASVAAVWGAGRVLTDLQTVSYRPLRRAVLRAEFAPAGEDAPPPARSAGHGPGQDDVVRGGAPGQDPAGPRTVYLKVMRGGLAAGLHHRHVLLAAAGVPVPPVLGPPVADVLALGEGTGTVLAGAIMADGARHVDPREVTDLLDRMPGEILSLPRREAWADRTPSYGHAAATALPDQARRIRSLVEHLQRQLATTDRGPVVPTHGDLYEANLLVRDGRISCVLDVDGAGPGHRVDDLACFLGHLAVLPAVDERYVFTHRALRRFHSHFVGTVDPGALACRSAAVALSLVAGARDSGRPDWQAAARQRLDIAESLLQLPQSSSGW
ncbi:aminoglycoside phosphotransferase family protein [Citricoccus sp. SGAir0253]|uniref:phosphotransferase family protein n=1 Tax=Citricoccus sp. SGAir0253 TaxID=2567881 RepID=UPI0010CD5B1C|nr:phosphotransferase [Citricoccus sp. SGAir0253]QCU77615.1 aminoglycoside phosphotransferase family protein [Citricoccus sp. SGAir0253]